MANTLIVSDWSAQCGSCRVTVSSQDLTCACGARWTHIRLSGQATAPRGHDAREEYLRAIRPDLQPIT
ncbi:hypothetical protein ABZ820_34725 [Streptomyces diacarni]|uniref:hypothetical protein n=1 Tax=Streptomyces diacarni TaxID=2800381 RepID=UPI0033C21A55